MSATTTMTARERLLDALRDAGCQVTGNGRAATCPAHDDNAPSLSIGDRRDRDGVVVKCHAGCDTADVLAVLELTPADLFDAPRQAGAAPPRVTVLALYPYTDEAGTLLYQKVRHEPKDFRQRRPDGNGGWSWSLGDARRVLYRLPAVVAAVAAGEPVYVAEGEKDADALTAAGVTATTWTEGAWRPGQAPKWRPEYTAALTGARVVIVRDRDEAGRHTAATIAATLAPVAASVAVVEPAEGKDATDHLTTGRTVADLAPVDLRSEPDTLAPEDDDDSPRQDRRPGGRESASARLCRIAQDRYTFGRATTGEPYALPVAGPRIVHMLRGGPTSLRAELAAAYLAEHGTPPTQQALADALTALEGICAAAEPERLWLRTAEAGGSLWLDVGDDTGRAIRVHPGGWELTETPPVLFRRTALTAPMPEPPTGGGDLTALWSVLNVAEQDRPLLLGFMVAALLPDIPHPVLSLAGEQGTGKSTAARIIGTTLDPSTVPLRKSPRDLDSWTTAAAGSHVVAVDNLSDIPVWLSEALCRASTGDGDVRRRLYTDGDLFVSSFRRVVILNGIDLGTVRDDLADRLVTVELDRIGEDRRERDGDLTARWQSAAPRILAGLLDLTAEVLAVLPTVRLDRSPRMADFAHVLAAVDAVRGTDALARYRALSGELAADAVAGDPVLAALTTAVTGSWKGTTTELLPLLDGTRGEGRPPRDWPKSARSLAGVLKRRAPSLRRVGWTVEQTEERTKRGQLWHLTPPADGGDERVTSAVTSGDETGDEDSSSPVRHPVRHPGTSPMTCDDAPNGQKGDEVTSNPANLSLSGQGEGEEAPDRDHMRDVPVSSSSRHSVTPAVWTRPGVTYCPDCGDPLDAPGLLTRCRADHEPEDDR